MSAQALDHVSWTSQSTSAAWIPVAGTGALLPLPLLLALLLALRAARGSLLGLPLGLFLPPVLFEPLFFAPRFAMIAGGDERQQAITLKQTAAAGRSSYTVIHRSNFQDRSWLQTLRQTCARCDAK